MTGLAPTLCPEVLDQRARNFRARWNPDEVDVIENGVFESDTEPGVQTWRLRVRYRFHGGLPPDLARLMEG